MYLEFYNLHLKPFQISTDPKFLWLGEKHKEALAVLKYGILDNKGFLLLTGDVGTGKTTLLNALTDSLGDDVLVALVADPGLAKMDFFNFVADSFEMQRNFKSKGDFLIYLKNFLLDVNQKNKQTLLIIDECQHLSQKMLEEVRLLSNIEKYNTKLINIFFVGQSEFNDVILRPRNRAIRQRITINYDISALSESETEKYIHFRLKVAGSNTSIFTSRAIKAIFKFSNGYPRLINIICDQSLLTGYVKEKRKIDEKIVTECANELKIPYGSPIKKSKATPEAGDERPVKATSTASASGSTEDKKQSSFSNPLVIALVVVLVIWGGLVGIFFFNKKPSISIDRVGASPGITDRTDHASVQNNHIPTEDILDKSGKAQQTTVEPKIKSELPGDSQSNKQKSEIKVKNEPPEDPPPPPASVTEDVPSSAENRVDPDVKKGKTQSSIASPDEVKTETRISLQEIKEKFGDHPEVHFGFNSNKLDRESLDILGLIAGYCIQNPGAAIVLKGYSDSSGVRAYNLKLSEFRADMVKTYMVGRGVKESSINSIAMGSEAVVPAVEVGSKSESQRKVVIEIIQPGE